MHDGREVPHEPLDRHLQIGDGERFRDALVHAGPHRFQHEGRIERRGYEEHARGRMIPLQHRERRRNRFLRAKVDDQHVRLRRARLREGRERLARDDGAGHARVANELNQLGVGSDQSNDGRQYMLRYRTRMICVRNDALDVSGEVVVPLDGSLINRPMTALPAAPSVMEPSAFTSPMPSMKNP